MGTVVVGYVPKPEGEAALATAISEAKLRGSRLVVVNSHRGGHDYDETRARAADTDMEHVRATLDESGLEYDIRQLVRGFEKRFGVVTEVLTGPAGDFPSYVVTPRGTDPRRTVLYLHGGGYVSGIDPTLLGETAQPGNMQHRIKCTVAQVGEFDTDATGADTPVGS